MATTVRFLCCLLGLLAVTSAFIRSEFSEEEIARGNAFVDDLLEDMLEDHGDEYDPYKMGDSVIGFSKKIAFVNISGEAKLFNGYIMGLKSLHRSGDCTLRREGDKINVVADLRAGVLDFYYSGTVKFMTMGPTITVHGILAYVELYMEFTVDENTGKNGELKEFYADDMRGMEIAITGLGPLNWAMNTFLSAIKYMFSGYIKNIVEGQAKGYISRRIRDYQFPVVAVTPTHEIAQTAFPEFA